MNDSELKHLLKSWQLPPPEEPMQARAKWRALTAFRHQEARPATTAAAPAFSFWQPFSALALGCLLLLAAVLIFRQPAAPSVADPQQLLSELEEFFQGRLMAVIRHAGDFHLQLADKPMPRPPDQRVLVEIQWREQAFEILTYSGVPVCVEGKTGTLCLTPLITGEGEVLLLSDSGLLKDQPGLRAHAHTFSET